MFVNGYATVTTMGTKAARERGVCRVLPLAIPEERAAEIATLLKALADPTRVQMVLALRDAREPSCVCDFTATFDLSQPTVSHHMARLRDVGLVDATRRGIYTYYRLRPHLPERVARIIEALA